MRVFVIEPVFDRDSQIHVFAQLRVDLAGMEKLVDQRGDRQKAVRHVREHPQIVEGRQLRQSLPDVGREARIVRQRHDDLAFTGFEWSCHVTAPVFV